MEFIPVFRYFGGSTSDFFQDMCRLTAFDGPDLPASKVESGAQAKHPKSDGFAPPRWRPGSGRGSPDREPGVSRWGSEDPKLAGFGTYLAMLLLIS